jgi:hypothetical protein
MKIIDNRKDFYDFSAGMYDTDDSIVYVRKTVDYQKKNTDDNVLIERVKDRLKNRVPEYIHKHGIKYASDQIYIEHLILGIYPNVYIVPFIVITEYDETRYERYRVTHTIPMPFDIYEDDNAIVSYIKNAYPELERKTFKLNTPSSSRKTIFASKKNFVTNKEFIFEDIELFTNIINAPTFIYMTDFGGSQWDSSAVRNLIVYKRNNTHTNHNYYTDLIVNPVFTDYDSKILKPIRDILDNTPVYNDIENFLWMTKQEPISEPDNKTKIINHGFDVKTSFRKM